MLEKYFLRFFWSSQESGNVSSTVNMSFLWLFLFNHTHSRPCFLPFYVNDPTQNARLYLVPPSSHTALWILLKAKKIYLQKDGLFGRIVYDLLLHKLGWAKFCQKAYSLDHWNRSNILIKKQSWHEGNLGELGWIIYYSYQGWGRFPSI